MRLAVLQRVCTSYRLPLFQALGSQPGVVLKLFYGDDIPHSKVRNAVDVTGIDSRRMSTQFLRVGTRVGVRHRGLRRELAEFEPDVVLTEGESHLLGYLSALGYRRQNPGVAVVHWSLGGLPGNPALRDGLIPTIVRILRRRFDAFVTYSSFGRDVLIANGLSRERIFVATNVSDVTHHLSSASSRDKVDARRRVGLDHRFVILFVGSITRDKRLDALLDAVVQLPTERFQAVIAGDGDQLEELKQSARQRHVENIRFAGRVTAELPDYYSSADVFVLPGRGGMVLSEAMAYSLPVIAWQADGTELDLIKNGTTGVLLHDGSGQAIADAIVDLSNDRDRVSRMGQSANRLVAEEYTLDAMVERILAACRYAIDARSAHDSASRQNT